MKLIEADYDLSNDELLSIALDKQFLPKSYYEFYKAAWKVVEPSTPFVENKVITFLCGVLQKEVERIARQQPRKKHLVINIPPRFGKSNLVTVFLNAWAWISYPHIKFITISYSGDLSEEHSIKTKEIIESPWYQLRFGSSFKMSPRKNTNKVFRNTLGGGRVSTSVGGGITGKGGDIIIFDDAIDPAKAVSEAERKRTNRWIGSSASNRLNDPEIGLFIYVQQRVHEDDAVGHVVAKDPDKYEMIVVPAELSFPVTPAFLSKYYTDGLLDPKRFPTQVLRDLKVSMGAQAYAGQFGQQPKATEGNIIKEAWFGRMTWETYNLHVGVHHPVVNYFIDTAYTEDRRNDPTAVLACVYFMNVLYVLGVTAKWMEFPELKRFIPEWCVEHGHTPASKVYIEPKASGLSVAQELKKSVGMNVLFSEAPKDTKEVRANAVAPFIEAGRVVLVDGSWTLNFVDECTSFPNAAHDDQVDVLINAIALYNKAVRVLK